MLYFKQEQYSPTPPEESQQLTAVFKFKEKKDYTVNT